MINGASIVLPLDSYRLAASEQRLVDHAISVLEQRCLRKAGFRGATVPSFVSEAVSDSGAAHDNSRRYGVIDPESAGRYGYHRPPQASSTLTSRAKARKWTARLNSRERRALFGATGNSGCQATALHALDRGVVGADGSWLTKADFDSADNSRKDPQVADAARRWSTCMADHGLHYAEPEAAIADQRWHLDAPLPGVAEIAVAKTDVQCKTLSGFVATWLNVETELQHRLIRNNSAVLGRIRTAKRSYLANASAAVR